MTRILVAGGAGYLGSVLVHMLLVHGYSVTVLDNFMHGQSSLNHLCSFEKLKIIRGNAREIAVDPKFVKSFDILIPLAAIVGARACELDYQATYEINTRAVQILTALARPEQIIVYPNTNSGYGKSGEALCTEETPLKPISNYGISKKEGESFVLRHPHGVSLRFATLFGASPRMRLDLMVNDFAYKAVRDRYLVIFEGAFRRNFLHVRDAAATFIFAIQHIEAMKGRAFNAGNSALNMTKLELAHQISAHTGCLVHEAPEGRVDPDQRDYIVSNARLEGLGWCPLYGLKEGIAELVRCFAQPFEGHRNA